MPEQGLTIFRNGQFQVSKLFDNAKLPTTGLDEGIGAGFARVVYKGGKWGIRYQGEYHPYEITLNNGQKVDSPYLDIVMLRSAAHSSKAWYEGAYTEGQMGPPDCYSSNGVVPDPASAKPQSRNCAQCEHNKFGSKINAQTGEAMKGKACMDMKRVAVVPVGDIENVSLGGPMMLSVPPSSLKRLVGYQNQLRGMGVNYATVWTRVSFVKQTNGQPMSYPLMDFDAMSGFNDEQADKILQMLEHPLIDRILGIGSQGVEGWSEAALQPATPAQMSNVAQASTIPATPSVIISDQVSPSGDQVTNNSTPQPDAPPPGVDPAQWAQFLAFQNAPQTKRKGGRPPSASGVRTPPVGPNPIDSAVVAAKQKAAHAAATPQETSQPTTLATPAAPGDAIKSLMAKIEKISKQV